MRKVILIAGALISAAALAIPSSGDTVVIDDFNYVLVSSGDWLDLTNRVAEVVAVHEKMMNTEEGRVAIHGKRGHTTITNGFIEVEYADGYVRRETVKANAVRPSTNSAPRRIQSRVFEMRPSRLEAILKKRREQSKKTREVVETVGGAK